MGLVGTREGTGDAFGKIQSKKSVDQYIVKFAAFLDKPKTTRDGDGTLLDHSLLSTGAAA